MNKERKHINEELKELGAENLLHLKPSAPNLPEGLKDELLAHLDKQQSTHVKDISRIKNIIWPLGIAAAIAIGLFLWIPNTQKEQLAFEDLSFEELEFIIAENISDYSEEDILTLASNEVNIFEYSSIEADFYEEEIIENLDLSYEDLF